MVALTTPRKPFATRFESYKAQREAMPDELKPQIKTVKELLELMGFIILKMPGWEGDDLMGSVKEKAKPDFGIFWSLPHLDMLQLVDEKLYSFNPGGELPI